MKSKLLALWLWLTAFAVLFGAEINAEADRQTARPPAADRQCRPRRDFRPSSSAQSSVGSLSPNFSNHWVI